MVWAVGTVSTDGLSESVRTVRSIRSSGSSLVSHGLGASGPSPPTATQDSHVNQDSFGLNYTTRAIAKSLLRTCGNLSLHKSLRCTDVRPCNGHSTRPSPEHCKLFGVEFSAADLDLFGEPLSMRELQE